MSVATDSIDVILQERGHAVRVTGSCGGCDFSLPVGDALKLLDDEQRVMVRALAERLGWRDESRPPLVTPSLADVSELVRMIEKHLCDDPDVQKMVPWVEATLTQACRVAR